MSENPKAFVIMPFDSEFIPIYKQLIKPALEEAGYDVRRADSFFDQVNILRDIVRGIAEAGLVVAELTIPNPNVYYELGLCHGLKIPAILIAQSMDEIPFDLRSYRILIYSTLFDQVNQLEQSLKEIGEKHINRQIKFGSPVIDFLPTESAKSLEETVTIVKNKDEITAEDHPEKYVLEESGFVDFLSEGTESSEKISGIISMLTAATTDLGEKIGEHNYELKSFTENPRPGAAAKVQKIAVMVAKDMDEYSDKVESLLPELEHRIEDFIENYTGYINWFPLDSEKNNQQLLGLREQINNLLGGTKTGLTGMGTLRHSVTKLTGISRDINRSSRRQSLILEKVLTAIEKVEAFCTKSLLMIDEKLQQKGRPQPPADSNSTALNSVGHA